MSSNIRETTEELLTPILADLSLELVDVEFKKEGKNWYLRVYIDKEDGVDLDDCTAVSEQLSEALDKQDPIEQAYYLEVSSPGAERPLKKEKDLLRAVGKNVHVTTYAPIDDEKVFEGKLVEFSDNILKIEIKVKTRKKIVEIPYDKVAKARLAVIF
ncbi:MULTISPECIES: ribosome maturation factor RimP [Bacillaceae]|uniref:Ribosome maturation factor RimP n=1 Tax=Evansella alkalicola TaxID=745819 RepID=A0ABS6JP70_9BACI|nr:ribosome maturation factor RimP [Litchfieldia alkalitelluris]MBU9720358.1 ribosome maturation factor RimP [Bacillus alkalicola]